MVKFNSQMHFVCPTHCFQIFILGFILKFALLIYMDCLAPEDICTYNPCLELLIPPENEVVGEWALILREEFKDRLPGASFWYPCWTTSPPITLSNQN